MDFNGKQFIKEVIIMALPRFCRNTVEPKKILLAALTSISINAFATTGLPEIQYNNCYASFSEIKNYVGKIKANNNSEWSRGKYVVVHEPGDEVFLGILNPQAALFEKPFSVVAARNEHENFQCLLNKNGFTVFRLEDLLLAGTIDNHGNVIQGEALTRLQNFASEFLTYDTSLLPKQEQREETIYKQNVIKQLTPQDLVKVILQQPTIKLRSTGTFNTHYSASYELKPLMNMYFMRDPVITTKNGLVIGKFNSKQRRAENKIAKFAYENLGIKPILEITGTGRLEGGDFIPAEDTSFIGMGLRTNQEAITQLLKSNAFSTSKVLVVKDPWKDQEQMHLDTYFNILNNHAAVMVEDRVDVKDGNGNVIKQANSLKKPVVDVYKLINGHYQLELHNYDFQKYLETQMRMEVIPVSLDDQAKYGINFLNIGEDKILGIDGVSTKYKNQLERMGIHATWMDFRDLTSGYGAAHCSTQVIARQPSN